MGFQIECRKRKVELGSPQPWNIMHAPRTGPARGGALAARDDLDVRSALVLPKLKDDIAIDSAAMLD